MTKQLVLAAGGVLVVVALAVAALTGAFANDDGASGDSAGRPGPTPKAGSPTIDPGMGNGRPPATAVPGIAVGEPTPPPNRPPSGQDTATRPAPAVPAAPTAPALPTLPPGTVRTMAPIESAKVAVLESAPPQYRLQVKAGLPSGCAKPGGYEVTKSANDVRVTVYNTMPTGNPVCTAIYGTYDVSIDLGPGFVAGQEYRVNVNGTQVTFRAQ